MAGYIKILYPPLGQNTENIENQDVLFLGNFFSSQEGLGGLEGFKNDPEPYGSVLSSYELISNHMDPVRSNSMIFIAKCVVLGPEPGSGLEPGPGPGPSPGPGPGKNPWQ